jgi:hypothetical protein
VDEQPVVTRVQPSNPIVLTIPANRIAGGERIAINWGSDYGPIAMTSFRLDGAPAGKTTSSRVRRRTEVSQ